MERAERVTEHRLQKIHLYGADEHRDELIRSLRELMGVGLKYSYCSASESNGIATRFMKELGDRTRVVLFSSNMEHII